MNTIRKVSPIAHERRQHAERRGDQQHGSHRQDQLDAALFTRVHLVAP